MKIKLSKRETVIQSGRGSARKKFVAFSGVAFLTFATRAELDSYTEKLLGIWRRGKVVVYWYRRDNTLFIEFQRPEMGTEWENIYIEWKQKHTKKSRPV
jgi:hypothetical protein